MPQVHFEIFRQLGVGGWSLLEVVEDRDAALDRARFLLDEAHAAAVRVVKETFIPDSGDYVSLTVFEEGNAQIKKKGKKTDDLDCPAPCLRPEDLYTPHARHTLSHLIGEWLAHHRLTATELLHSARALEAFEETGTALLHAVQKVAVAQASESGLPVTHLVKQLNELCAEAIKRVHKDDMHGLFPITESGKFAELAKSLGGKSDGRYILNGVLAKYLAAGHDWSGKLQLLLALMAELPADGPPRTLLVSCIDSLVAETLTGSAALHELLGHNPDLGHALVNLTELFLGAEVHPGEGASGDINALARIFAKDELPEARSAILSRILAEVRGLKRLCPNSLGDEFKLLRRLADQLVRGQGKYLSHESLIEAFLERSRHLVTQEPLVQFMQEAKTPDEKLDRLLIVEENIIGADNKHTLSTFIMPIVTSNNFEDQLCGGGAPVLQRLKRLADLQTCVLRSGFVDIEKNKIAMALDAVAQHIEERAKFLASLETRYANPVERAQALLKLCAAHVFTQGDLSMKARRALIAALGKPGFLSNYMEHMKTEKKAPMNRDSVLAELASQLQGIGIAPEDALRALAA